MLAVIDYGAGNLYSVCNTLDYLNIPHTVTADAEALEQASGLILPGVGAFADAMAKLGQAKLVEPIRQQASQKPLLGICLGMQLLFETGYEFGTTPGLGLIPGTVERIQAPGLKIPHMGWNDVTLRRPCPLTKGIPTGSYFYFVHSFCANTPPEFVSFDTGYGQQVPALVTDGRLVFGAQFHPEKSAAVGLQLLRNFWEFTRERSGGTC